LEKNQEHRPIKSRVLDSKGCIARDNEAYSPKYKGRKNLQYKPFYRERMVTVIGAISPKKVIAMKTIVKSINEEKVLKFVQEELAQNLWDSPKTSRPCRNFIMPLTPLTALTYW